ncbi:MAG: GNAT family N-acetyltransferase [Kiritimatiellales bacterium]|jgi:ribosomal protein S18 acetylase RimI-like enzyme
MNNNVPLIEGTKIYLRSCNREDDRQLIRDLTEQNFRTSFERTIGWDAARHERQPEFPEYFTMVTDAGQTIGFISVRQQPDVLYLETIQLQQTHRSKGIGTALMKYVEQLAVANDKEWIRFRVFKNNPARHLYDRLGYQVAEDQDWCFLMEKKINPNQSSEPT